MTKAQNEWQKSAHQDAASIGTDAAGKLRATSMTNALTHDNDKFAREVVAHPGWKATRSSSMGPYNIIMADPPWRFEPRNRKSGLGKSPDRHYGTMTTTQLIDPSTCPDVAKDAVLAMWVYDPMLPAALVVAEAWGFKFVTVLFRWLKTTKNGKLHYGTGYHTRGGGCEEVWLFKRGKGLPVLRHDIRKEFYAPLREHSRKPDQVAQWLVDLYGDKPRLEMFARTKRPGWNCHGFETGKFT